jgi:type I restriction enzyme, S subunit
MSELPWGDTRIEELATAIKDGTHGSFRRVRRGIPFLSAKNVTEIGEVVWDDTDDRVSEEDYGAITRTFTPQKHDILITIVGTLGRRALFNGDQVAFQRSVAFVRANEACVLPRFLYHAVGSPEYVRQLIRRSNATAQAGLYLGELSKTTIPLPPDPDEQYRIAAVLSVIDGAIATTEAVIAKLKQVRAGMIHDLLTCGIDDNGELRDSVAHAERFQESSAGLIPKAWQDPTLGDAADWFSGGTPSRSEPSFWSGEIPLLTPKDMKVSVLSDTSEHITQAAVRVGSRLMPMETVFIVVRGMILAHTFPVCLSSRPFAFNQDIKAIRGRAALSNRFLAQWFAANSSMFLRRATEATHGTKKLDTPDLLRVHIGIPRPEEQAMIVERIESLDSDLSNETAIRSKLTQVKSGLISDLLTGRVRVPESAVSTEVPE